MATELPHALLSCSECGTGFKLTLKKGRPPSKPVPCPTCKSPITVTEDHIVQPGQKTGQGLAGGKLRETKPGEELRRTKLVNPDEIGVDEMMDPPSRDVSLDPPTAEVDVDAVSLTGSGDTPKEASEPVPQAGVLRRRGLSSNTTEREKSSNLMGIKVTKTSGKGSRDNVFGQRKAGSMPLARIGAMRKAPAQSVDADDADLPALAGDSSAQDSGVEPAKDENLDALMTAMSELDLSDVSDAEFEQPLSDFESEIEESEISEPGLDFPSLAEDSEPEAEAEPDDVEDDGEEPDEAEESDGSAAEQGDETDEGAEESGELDEEELEDDEPDTPEADVEDDSEPEDEPEVDEQSEPSEVGTLEESSGKSEPEVVTLDVEDSEGYELGDADVPERLEDSQPRGGVGAIIAIVLLLVIAAITFVAF